MYNEDKSTRIFTDSKKNKAANRNGHLTKDEREYLRSKDYNYGLKTGADVLSSNKLVANLQKKAQPVTQFFREMYYRLEDSSKRRRKTTLAIVFTLMIGSVVSAQIWTKGIEIVETPMKMQKTFINGDKISLKKQQYDKKTHTARLDFVTSSDTGIVSPKDIKASFMLVDAPKDKVKAPELYVVPTFNNHFVVIIKHLYDGFNGMKVQFTNKSTISLDQISDSLGNGNNGTSQKAAQTSSDSNSDTHLGAYHIKKSDVDTIGDTAATQGTQTQDDKSKINTGNHHVTAKQLQILERIEKHNTQYVIVKEDTLLKHKTKFNSNIKPKKLAVSDLKNEVQRLKTDIQNNEDFIEKDKPYIKSLTEKVRDLSKDVGVDASYQDKIDDTNEQIAATKNADHNYEAKIKLDQKWIERYKDRIRQIRSGRLVVDCASKPSKAVVFQATDKK
jgi:hypothetical protein